ncbi:Ku protein [Streptomyces sp. NPDC026092]|uniref:Ku protein n=1 Tax=Streptomyces sp. NPDC026092 TaxID=3154797 RepID=UPI0034070C37
MVFFVPWDSIGFRRIGESSYCITADGPVAAKPYALLRQALGRNEKVAVARFALRGCERLGLVRPYGDVLLLHAMRWDDEVRDPNELAPDAVDLTEQELAEAIALLDGRRCRSGGTPGRRRRVGTSSGRSARGEGTRLTGG